MTGYFYLKFYHVFLVCFFFLGSSVQSLFNSLIVSPDSHLKCYLTFPGNPSPLSTANAGTDLEQVKVTLNEKLLVLPAEDGRAG